MEPKKLILLIDDEQDFIDIIKFHLENSNFNVISDTKASEGIKKAQQFIPDLILLDLMMPQLNGHQTCHLLKENQTTRHIPIIMLTSIEDTLEKVQAFNLGVVDYINKMAHPDEILVRIKSALKIATSTSDPAAEQERTRRVMLLRKVLDEKDIRILFQPIVSLQTREPIGFEALSRGPQGSEIENPLSLFHLAYQSNMFSVLDELCRTLAVERANFLSAHQILFLNTDPMIITSSQFKKLGFLGDKKIPPAQICLELTELSMVRDFDQFSLSLSEFKNLGFKIAVDDAGEGYSSLKAIAEFRPDFIKIGMSLVRHIDSDTNKRNIVQTIIELAKKINSKVIAEGIETEKEYALLADLHCDCGQGYLFGKPSEHTSASPQP